MDTQYIKEINEISGKIIRVGGETPKVRFEITGGKVISCKVKEEDAKTIGKNLYRKMILSGTSCLNPNTLEIESFEIESFKETKNKTRKESWKRLTEIISPYFKEIDDVDEYMLKIRRGDI